MRGTYPKDRGAYVVEWGVFGWCLRSVETGAAWPNGRGMIGQHATYFPDPEKARDYAVRHKIELAELAV